MGTGEHWKEAIKARDAAGIRTRDIESDISARIERNATCESRAELGQSNAVGL